MTSTPGGYPLAAHVQRTGEEGRGVADKTPQQVQGPAVGVVSLLPPPVLEHLRKALELYIFRAGAEHVPPQLVDLEAMLRQSQPLAATTAPLATDPGESPLMTHGEVASALVKSKRTVGRLLHDGHLARVGRCISRASVEAYVRGRTDGRS
jgi:hypothetical protein